MDTITQLVLRQVSELKKPQNSSLSSQQKTIIEQITERYGDRENFLIVFNPDRQVDYCEDVVRCITGKAPTLFQLGICYGSNMPVMFLVPQLLNLSEFCGCRDKLSTPQLREVARIISNRYGYLKVTDLMLFFYRFKAGDYGRFYGAVDPLVITTALTEFVSRRNRVIAYVENEQRKQRLLQQESEAISYAEYLQTKNQENDTTKSD